MNQLFKIIIDQSGDNLTIVILLLGISCLLSIAIGIGVFIVKVILKYGKTFYDKQIELEQKHTDNDKRLNTLEDIVKGVQSILEQIVPLIRDNHNKIAIDNRSEIKRASAAEWDAGIRYTIELIEKVHSEYWKKPNEYYKYIEKHINEQIIERNKSITVNFNPTQKAMAREMTIKVFIPFLKDLEAFIYDISSSEKLPRGWSADLRRIGNTYKQEWDINFEIYYGELK